jgi:signal transduction histidine kinase
MRRQLLALIAATTSLVLIAFLVPIALLLRSEAEQRAVSAATLRAQSLAPLVPDMTDGSLPPDGPATVFLADGKVIGAPARRTPSVELAATGRAFTAHAGSAIEVLVPVQSGSGTSIVRVLVLDRDLHRGVVRTWIVLALLGLVLFGVGLIVADRLGRRLVRSVTDLGTTADRLAAGDLAARATVDGPPELRHVSAELNRLAARIGSLLADERAEVADLAHRLRTPLTALRLNADGLRDAAEAGRVARSVQSLAAQVDELIRTARRPLREGAGARGDLGAVAADRLAFWQALAEDTGRPLRGELPDSPVIVTAAPADLAAAVDVLLDNAFTHTPDGVAVQVGVAPDGRIWVDDAGPGFAESMPREGSTGLGLDIARRTAAAAGGSLTISRSPMGGARVALTFGLAS